MSRDETVIRGAAIELFDAVEYILGRIQRDADFSYQCGYGTESFARLCSSYALATGRTVKDVEAAVLREAKRRSGR